MASTIDDSDDGIRLNAAAVWHSRLQSDADSDSVWIGFTDWLEADAANLIAFDQVEALYAGLDAVVPSRGSIERAEPVSNVVVLAEHQRRFTPMRVGFAGLAALAASLAVFVGIRLILVGPDAVRYATKTGETRTVALADGTTVEMNTASTFAVTFSGRERRVTLDQGEILIRVAKDSARPFLVTVGGRDVRDVGTVFNVLRDHARTVVTVESGKVSVSPGDAGARDPVLLSAGDQLAVEDGTGDAVNHVDPAQATSWRKGYLTYKEAPLSVVISDLNRYFAGRIFLADKDAGVRRFSGVLKIDDEDAVLNRLAQLLPLVVDREGDGDVALRLKRQGD